MTSSLELRRKHLFGSEQSTLHHRNAPLEPESGLCFTSSNGAAAGDARPPLELARLMCDCDIVYQLELGLDVIVNGLEARL